VYVFIPTLIISRPPSLPHRHRRPYHHQRHNPLTTAPARLCSCSGGSKYVSHGHAFDKTPHKIPSVVTSDPAQSWNLPTCNAKQIRSHSAFQTSSANLDALPPQSQPTPSHISMFHIPPLPIIYLSSCSSSHPPMDVDPALADRSIESRNSSFPQHNESQPEQNTQKPSSCCAVAHGKAEMEHLLLNFKFDLDRIITTSFRSSQTPPETPICLHPWPLPPRSSATTPP